jgi:hypothetical protein
MDLTLLRSTATRKNPRLVIFNIEGRPGSVQFFRALFPQDTAHAVGVPAKLHLTGEFAPPRVKETPEQRKARLASQPKLTPQQKLVRMEQRLAAMKAQLAAPQPVAKPVADGPTPPAKPNGKAAKR